MSGKQVASPSIVASFSRDLFFFLVQHRRERERQRDPRFEDGSTARTTTQWEHRLHPFEKWLNIYPTEALGVVWGSGNHLRSKDMHTDDSDVTFNVCLGKDFKGAGLQFCGNQGAPDHRCGGKRGVGCHPGKGVPEKKGQQMTPPLGGCEGNQKDTF